MPPVAGELPAVTNTLTTAAKDLTVASELPLSRYAGNKVVTSRFTVVRESLAIGLVVYRDLHMPAVQQLVANLTESLSLFEAFSVEQFATNLPLIINKFQYLKQQAEYVAQLHLELSVDFEKLGLFASEVLAFQNETDEARARAKIASFDTSVLRSGQYNTSTGEAA
ncbi:hypothetical protein WJX74_006757 [Apatococcus lobatus]|uniref:Uncharacterized protein n=2 Tax=Apatococcus TaxID=904362 RepID=A0AAW1RSU2_9CHLO